MDSTAIKRKNEATKVYYKACILYRETLLFYTKHLDKKLVDHIELNFWSVRTSEGIFSTANPHKIRRAYDLIRELYNEYTLIKMELEMIRTECRLLKNEEWPNHLAIQGNRALVSFSKEKLRRLKRRMKNVDEELEHLFLGFN